MEKLPPSPQIQGPVVECWTLKHFGGTSLQSFDSFVFVTDELLATGVVNAFIVRVKGDIEFVDTPRDFVMAT